MTEEVVYWRGGKSRSSARASRTSFALHTDGHLEDALAAEPVADATLPDGAGFAAAGAEALSGAFAASLDDEEGPAEEGAGGAKQPGAAKRTAAEATEDSDVVAAAAEMAQLAESGRLVATTVHKLMSYLRAHGLPLLGKKAFIMERIAAHAAKAA